jgi:hypothetical protein
MTGGVNLLHRHVNPVDRVVSTGEAFDQIGYVDSRVEALDSAHE